LKPPWERKELKVDFCVSVPAPWMLLADGSGFICDLKKKKKG